MRFFLGLTLGCLWYYGTNVHGGPAQVNDRPPNLYLENLTDDHRHRELQNDRNPLPDPGPGADYKVRSDYAATLVHRGEVQKAIGILEDLEKRKPGEYIVAANLGTAYELAGDDVRALHWIRECLQRNAESHYGTEWLHERILEAKIALAKDPSWLRRHTVLGVDFGTAPAPSMPEKLPQPLASRPLRASLEYQLHERMGFVKPPDPVVADLLIDLGNLAALELSAEHAIAVYDLALAYKPVREKLVTRRRDHLKFLVEERHRLDSLKQFGLYSGAAVGVLVLLALWLRFRRVPS